MSPIRHLILGASACVLLAATPAVARCADEGGITLPRASARAVGGVYVLDAVADIRLTQPVHRALHNGVALTFAWRIEIRRERNWWLDTEVATMVQRYRLEYHDLSRRYIVTNRNTGERRSFTRLRVALDSIATLIGFPAIDRVLVSEPARYSGFVRLALLHNTLPLPLRPEALFSSAWDLETDWRRWSFE